MSDQTDSKTYEQKFSRLESILKRLDDSQTPIDELAADVKEGTALILELNAKLREVETEVADAFKTLEAASKQPE
jgi:exodeoxyribonuclease VII small subunit